ncbi:MAG TPA: extracellular solute-binding protein, partial [Roseiarcus sp.]|nr:extracellular solute-binding protein [Roseiarcus sp.]
MLSIAVALSGPLAPSSAETRYEGVTLNLASQNDQFAAVLAALAPEFEKLMGAKVNVDILSYPELLTKITADYVGHTKGYDIATVDIVWSGQFAEAGYTVDLTDWIKRDAAEIKVDDIYPSLMSSLGGYKGKQIAFPFAGYANVLAYRKDLYDAAGLKPPTTMEDFVADALKLTDPSKRTYGFVANGPKGPAVAQDWMQYNRQFGGSILNAEGRPSLNSPANVASLIAYKKLFDKTAPPGAVDYDWGGREESFRQGLVANMQTWSIGAADYDNPKVSKIAGKAGIVPTPMAKGLPQEY